MSHLATTLTLLIAFSILNYSLTAPCTLDNAPYNVNFHPDHNPTDYFGEWPGHVYFKSPQDWRSVPVYQFVTDRFRDGKPENNEEWNSGYDLYRIDTRHGGDFKGVTQKLDYIKSLGFTAIWISPVFLNGENSYHGYAQHDFTVLDPRFGTVDDFRELTQAAHSKGMFVIVDIVVNHMDNLLYFEGHERSGTPFHMHHGEYQLFWRNESKQYVDFKPNNTFISSGKYPDVYGDDGYALHDSSGAEGSFWSSDFHHNGDLENYADAYQNHEGKIYGIMDDLRSENPVVQQKIIAMTKALISTVDIDGIRMDTPMQVPRTFFDVWTPAVKAHAKSLGKDNFFIFGEFYCTKERASTMCGRGKSPNMYGKQHFLSQWLNFDSGINYPLYWWMQTAIRDQKGNVAGIITSYMDDVQRYDLYNPDRNEDQYRFLSFFNNHDQWRLAASEDGFAKSRLATAVISLFPGIPLYYYGDEQHFLTQGTALDGWSREDMMTSLAWRNLSSHGQSQNPANGDSFDQVHPDYLWTQNLLNIRRQYTSLRACDKVQDLWHQEDGRNGILVTLRSCGDPVTDSVLVAINTWKGILHTTPFDTFMKPNLRVVNILDPRETATIDEHGRLQISVPGYGTKIFVVDAGVKELDPVVLSVSPPHDTAIFTNDSAISYLLEFSSDMDESSLRSSLTFSGCYGDLLEFKYADRQLALEVKVQGAGLLHLRLSESSRSASGRTLFGAFEHRIRIGNRQNIIMDPVSDARLDSSLIVKDSSRYLVYHKAIGAQKFRITAPDGRFGAWTDVPPSQMSTLEGVSYPIGTRVIVQYWADGSAAYFVECTV